MRVLVVQDDTELSGVWTAFLRRRGLVVDQATTGDDAIDMLAQQTYDALVLEPQLASGGALPVADVATFQNPTISIVVVTRSTFFSDSDIYSIIPNARGVLHTPIRPDDLAAYLEHYGSRDARRATTPKRDISA